MTNWLTDLKDEKKKRSKEERRKLNQCGGKEKRRKKKGGYSGRVEHNKTEQRRAKQRSADFSAWKKSQKKRFQKISIEHSK